MKKVAPKKQPLIKKIVVPAKKAVAKKVVIVPKKIATVSKKNDFKAIKSIPKKNQFTTTNKSATAKPVTKVIEKPVAKKIENPVKKSPIENVKTKTPVEAVPKKAVVVPEKKSIAPVQKTAAQKQAAQKQTSNKPTKPVIIPKTSTDKKVDYEPDFLKSVLDTPEIIPTQSTMRYNDSELNEFKELINKKLDAAKKELSYLQGLITRKDEMGGDETDNRYVTMEDGGMSMEREQLSQMASRQITFIDHLEKAIMRIENKTYGICRVSGKLIDKARLRAVPHATLSMEAKLGIVK